MIRVVGVALVTCPLFALAQEATPAPAAPSETTVAEPARPVVAAPPAVAAPPSEPATPAAATDQARFRSYLGFGYGAAYTSESGGGSGGATFRLHVGSAQWTNVMVGFEGGLTTRDDGTLTYYDAAFTMFPRSWLYVRGGFGVTTSSYAGTTEQGTNGLVGVGVVLPRTLGWHMTLNLEVMNHGISSGDAILAKTGPRTFSAWVGVDWL